MSVVEMPIGTEWFLIGYDDKGFIGDDCYFCLKAKAAGFDIHIDHDLTKLVAHTAAIDLGWHMGLADDELAPLAG